MGEDECTARRKLTQRGRVGGVGLLERARVGLAVFCYQLSDISDQEPRVWQAGGRPKWGGQGPVCYFQVRLAVG